MKHYSDLYFILIQIQCYGFWLLAEYLKCYKLKKMDKLDNQQNYSFTLSLESFQGNMQPGVSKKRWENSSKTQIEKKSPYKLCEDFSQNFNE